MQLLPVVALVLLCADPSIDRRFSEVEIEKAFEQFLTANLLLMDVGGAKIIRLPDGNSAILSVASTVLKDESAKDRLRAEKVCRNKALASIVAERQGIQVAHIETLEETSKVVIDDKGEHASSISELLQLTKTEVQGIIKDLPVVGRWKSKDGDVFYLAIGAIVDKQGNRIGGDE